MSVEGKDFDDKSIMSATKQEVGQNGSFRLSIELPLSKRKVTSEWIREDKRREALFAWVATVRQQADQDIAEYQDERKRTILASRSASSILVGTDRSTGGRAAAPVGVPAQTAHSSELSTDPNEYVNQALTRALGELEAALAAKSQADARAAAAESAVAKWKQLKGALGAT